MNWHTANLRKQRALKRTRRKKFTQAQVWREWLDRVLPDLVFSQSYINEHSIFNRIMAYGKSSGPGLFSRVPFPRMPGPPSPRRGSAPYFIFVDDIDFSVPAIPRITKRFIYGENWNAYQLNEELNANTR